MNTQNNREVVIESYNRLRSGHKVYQELKDTLNIPRADIYQIIRELKGNIEQQEKELEDLNNAIQTKVNYQVADDHYVFYKKDEDGNIKPYPIAIKTVDKIFKAYSKHGENKTGEQILQEFKIKPELWMMLKNRLRLYKDSHILSPVSLERFEGKEEEMNDFINSAVEETIRDKYVAKFQKSYDNVFKEHGKKALKRMADIQNFLEYLRGYIENYRTLDIDFTIEEPKNNKTADIVISDIHIGKKNTEQIYDRLNIVANDIVAMEESNINIFCLGDLAEMLVEGGRHPGQIESMDGPFGFDLFMNVVNILEQFLLFIHRKGKRVKFIGITGNHGTLSDKKGGDIEFTGELLIYELIKRGLRNSKIEINYLRNKWNTYKTDNYYYILNHGSGNETNKPSQNILWEYGDNKEYNIILQGDKHHSKMTEVNERATRLLVPCLAGSNTFDENLGLSSNTGYVKIKKSHDNLPEITFKKLK